MNFNVVNNSQSALLVIDVQNCFMPTGTLPVPDGDKILPVVNDLMKKFENVILTQDWHPAEHISFASSHQNKKAFEQINLDYGAQVLWPDHALQGTVDADFHPLLQIQRAQLIIRKGFHSHTDSYSAFVEADRQTKTGLTGYLHERGINTVYLVGLATDFCVAWSALDARANGFNTLIIEEGTRAINLNGSLAKAWQEMSAVGILRL